MTTKTITHSVELTPKFCEQTEVMRNFEINRQLTEKRIPVRGAISIQYPTSGKLTIQLSPDASRVIYTWEGPDLDRDHDLDDLLGDSGVIEHVPVKPDMPKVPEVPVKPDTPKVPETPVKPARGRAAVKARQPAMTEDDLLG